VDLASETHCNEYVDNLVLA